jgi:hypothetical protein
LRRAPIEHPFSPRVSPTSPVWIRTVWRPRGTGYLCSPKILAAGSTCRPAASSNRVHRWRRRCGAGRAAGALDLARGIPPERWQGAAVRRVHEAARDYGRAHRSWREHRGRRDHCRGNRQRRDPCGLRLERTADGGEVGFPTNAPGTLVRRGRERNRHPPDTLLSVPDGWVERCHRPRGRLAAGGPAPVTNMSITSGAFSGSVRGGPLGSPGGGLGRVDVRRRF